MILVPLENKQEGTQSKIVLIYQNLTERLALTRSGVTNFVNQERNGYSSPEPTVEAIGPAISPPEHVPIQELCETRRLENTGENDLRADYEFTKCLV